MVRKEDQPNQGTFLNTRQPGDYTIEVSASHEGKPLGTKLAQAQFIVSEQDLDLDNPSSDPDAMKGLANASGGEVVRAEMLPSFLDELLKKTDDLDVKQETKLDLWHKFLSLPTSLLALWPWFFDIVEWFLFSPAGLLFNAILLVLTVEWYLRKRWGLV